MGVPLFCLPHTDATQRKRSKSMFKQPLFLLWQPKDAKCKIEIVITAILIIIYRVSNRVQSFYNVLLIITIAS